MDFFVSTFWVAGNFRFLAAGFSWFCYKVGGDGFECGCRGGERSGGGEEKGRSGGGASGGAEGCDVYR